MDSRQSLFNAWEGENGHAGKHRPQWVREHRDDLAEYVDTEEPIPNADASTAEFRDWLERHKGTVTRQLNDDSDGSDPHDGESDLSDADEEGQ